jgi:hypothetical protein
LADAVIVYQCCREPWVLLIDTISWQRS